MQKTILVLILICSTSLSKAQETPKKTESDQCHDYKRLFTHGISIAVLVKIIQDPVLLEILGFGELGIMKDTMASKFQSYVYKGETPSESVFATLQSIAMKKKTNALKTFMRFTAIGFQVYLTYDLLYCYGEYQESIGQPNHLKELKIQIYDLIQSNEYTKQTQEQISQLLEQTSELLEDSINSIINNEKFQYVNETVSEFMQQQGQKLTETYAFIISDPLVSQTIKQVSIAKGVVEKVLLLQMEKAQSQMNYLTNLGQDAANTALQTGQEYVEQISNLDYAEKLKQTERIIWTNGQALIDQATNTLEDIALQTKNQITDTIQNINIQAISEDTAEQLKQKYEWMKTFF